MINTFQGELYLLETKQAKGARIPANIRWDLDGERCSKNFFQSSRKTKYAKPN